MARSAVVERAGLTWTAAVALSIAALAARGVDRWSWTVAVCGGAVGLAVPLGARLHEARLSWPVATVVGCAAFVVTRTLWTFETPGGRTAVLVAVAAAVGEEALFRRGVYGFLERRGAFVAVVCAAVLFGLAHVPVYGWAVLPVDIAAGIVFGWQRWASGSWTAPAVAHAVANAVQYL